ncbi:PTS beta-glucoside transporter subunit EIIBCA [Paenibacillus sp. CFBP13512]|uniref:beta-glucoside-specific PTS transporter subunit IIABC n=1 Tax=Paenibacillus sp. CFBP13512 TaxID=2184007 RepID=UPI0010C0ACC4|nr:beta-glucoside-specific PTS transporter subunit IIABC [Paenibacillus sp. CFBP13512]TKJ89517.1 PTS beta-glucoside transporter subunit EIIBCA [Paenibacillus sp. CFBP13512]
MSHSQTAKQIVEAVGGTDNINSVFHCITRLRFDLKDNSKVNSNALKSIDKVMGTNISGDQFQVIVGNDVPKVFDSLVEQYPALQNSEKTTSKEDSTHSSSKKKNVISSIFDVISGVFAPILPAIAGAGLLKGLIALLVSLGWMSAGTDTYRIISAIGDGVFYFLPILLAVSAARKFGANPYVAVAVGASLLYPDMGALLSSGNGVSFIGIPVTAVSYASSVIPILLSIWLMSYVEKYVDRYMPSSLKLLFVPLITLLVVVPITLILIGPLGTFIGDGLSGVINWLIAKGGIFAGILIGGTMSLLVMTGMHYALVPVIISNLAKFGVDKFLPITYIANMGQAGATFGVFFRAKDKKLKSLALSTGLTALMGVTEPAIYGVNITYKKPFLAGLIGSAAGGAIALGFGANAYVLAGNGGIPGLPALIGPTFVYSLLSMAVAFIVAVIVSYILGIKENGVHPAEQEVVPSAPVESDSIATSTSVNLASEQIMSPMNGQAIALQEVNDPTFADEMMGKGIAFVPSEGILASPVTGTVLNVFKTKHAMVIRSEHGAEILIHVGINTVKLRGEFFEAHVKTGDQVNTGDLLLTFELDKIAEQYDITTAMVVTNTNDYQQIEPIQKGNIQINQPVLQLNL